MHIHLPEIRSELEQLAAAVKALPSNEPFSIAHGAWNLPGLTRDEIAASIAELIERIDLYGDGELAVSESLLGDYPRRIAFLRVHTIPQLWGGNGQQALSSLQQTIGGLELVLAPMVDGGVEAKAVEAARSLNHANKKIRSIEARIQNLDPRSMNLLAMIERIEQAHDAADKLPTDLASLAEAREAIRVLAADSTKDKAVVEQVLSEVKVARESMTAMAVEAEVIIKRCFDAYRAQSSDGLASAFSTRSKSIASSMWVWVFGLVGSLALGASLGSRQLQSLSDALKGSGQHDSGAIWVDLLLALLSIGGPVWFAWISTKQIGQRFRLAEDYGYKASISKAYEGYRREAEELSHIDSSFQARLFSSALTRLEELPLRLVESSTHGSPWHELLSSDTVKDAARLVPGFVDQVSALAKTALGRAEKPSTSPTAATPITPPQ